MEIKVKKTTEEVIEITLPYFFKTSISYVAVLSEEGYLEVNKNSTESGVAEKHFCNAFQTYGTFDRTEITAQEFHEAMLQEINELTVKLHNISAMSENQFIKDVSLNAEGY